MVYGLASLFSSLQSNNSDEDSGSSYTRVMAFQENWPGNKPSIQPVQNYPVSPEIQRLEDESFLKGMEHTNKHNKGVMEDDKSD